ncbi:hypothetical protein [Enterococcus sp. DIV2381]
MFKKIRNISIVLFIINLFILVVVPIVFSVIFKISPNLDPSPNGLGVVPLLAVILGVFFVRVTGPIMFIMLMIDIARNVNVKNNL